MSQRGSETASPKQRSLAESPPFVQVQGSQSETERRRNVSCRPAVVVGGAVREGVCGGWGEGLGTKHFVCATTVI